jgi:hypothetical protein
MGIEPTRAVTPEPENKRFGMIADPKCDWRVNYDGTPGHVGIRQASGVTSNVPGDHVGRTVYTPVRQLSTMLQPS